MVISSKVVCFNLPKNIVDGPMVVGCASQIYMHNAVDEVHFVQLNETFHRFDYSLVKKLNDSQIPNPKRWDN